MVRLARGGRVDLCAAVLVAVAVLLPLPGLLSRPATSMEEGTMLAGPELVTRGLVPNRDFEHLYGPAGQWTVAAVFEVTGPSLRAQRVVGLAHRVLLLWAVYRLARRAGPVAATAAAITTWVVIAPFGLIAYSWVAGVSFVAAGVAVALGPRPGGPLGASGRRAAIAGVLVAVGLAHRPDLVVAAGGALAVLALGRRPPLPRRPLTGGLAAGLAPLAAHLLVAGPARAFEGMVVDPVVRLRPGRRLPLPPSWRESAEFFAALGDPLAPDPPWPALAPPAQVAFVFWLTVAAVALSVGLGALRLVRRGDRWLLVIGVLAAGTIPQMLQRPSPNHVKFVAMVALAVGLVALAEALRPHLGRRAAAGVAAVVVIGGLVAVAPHHVGRFAWRTLVSEAWAGGGPQLQFDGRSLPVGSAELRDELAPLLAILAVEGRAGDRVFVGPVDLARTNYGETWLYHLLLARFRPASYHLEMNPGLANRTGGRLAMELAEADWLVLTSAFDGWREPNTSVRPGDPGPGEVVERRFCERARRGSHVLLGRCPP